mmetsp:Transcript_11656/g.40241  ORF Transcript_11656/g.40241 Transcript_11656/m.40241 type:complete len:289 (+) Transcript_11656:356-1222(+)
MACEILVKTASLLLISSSCFCSDRNSSISFSSFCISSCTIFLFFTNSSRNCAYPARRLSMASAWDFPPRIRLLNVFTASSLSFLRMMELRICSRWEIKFSTSLMISLSLATASRVLISALCTDMHSYALSPEPATIPSSCSVLRPSRSSSERLESIFPRTISSASAASLSCFSISFMSFFKGSLMLELSDRVHLTPNFCLRSLSVASSSSITRFASWTFPCTSSFISRLSWNLCINPLTPSWDWMAAIFSFRRLGRPGSLKSQASTWGVIVESLLRRASVSAFISCTI